MEIHRPPKNPILENCQHTLFFDCSQRYFWKRCDFAISSLHCSIISLAFMWKFQSFRYVWISGENKGSFLNPVMKRNTFVSFFEKDFCAHDLMCLKKHLSADCINYYFLLWCQNTHNWNICFGILIGHQWATCSSYPKLMGVSHGNFERTWTDIFITNLNIVNIRYSIPNSIPFAIFFMKMAMFELISNYERNFMWFEILM